MAPPIANVMAASWNGGTRPDAAVNSASSDHIRTAVNPTRVAPRRLIRSNKILSAVRRQGRAGDEARLVGGEEDDAARDLLRLAQAADGNQRDDALLQHVLR